MNQMNSTTKNSYIKDYFAICMIFILLFSMTLPVVSQTRISGATSESNKKLSKKEKKDLKAEQKLEADRESASKPDAVVFPQGERTGEKIIVKSGGERTSADIMNEQSSREGQKTGRELVKELGIRKVEKEVDRSNLKQNPDAPNVSRFPFSNVEEITNYSALAPQPIGLSFDTVNGPAETGAFPPDTMGAVGPTQFFVALNGRFRTFSKATGLADGVINVDSDVFFASVMTPGINFSTDPNVRFDRLSGRWFLNMIDVPNGTGATANRIMIAVSDGPTITAATVWTYYQFTGSTTLFTDYQSFGVDASALYIGANMFTLAGGFSRCDGWVIPKAPSLVGGAVTIYAFAGIATGAAAGPFAPRGVDNVDPSNTGPTATGYFIGVDTLTFSTLKIRRVTNPGASGGAPTISATISLTVPTTNDSTSVTHLGNTGGTGGNLDALGDRLYAAVLRNGRLWTAHNIRTGILGTASTTQARHAIRWYEIQNLGTTPTLFQSGTVFDDAATTAIARQYWIPSVTVSGQGHAAIGASTAGTAFRADAFTTGRLVGDALGTMRNSPGSIPGYTATTAAYNATSGNPRRWGDYSFTSLDPLDDMTIWTIQQYASATNVYNTRVAQLLAPLPANIANGPDAGGLYNVPSGLTSFNLTISGTSVSGSGFYDPGSNLGGGAVNFNHIAANVSGANVTVNSVTYNNPTSITLNLNTVGATISNPNLSPDTVRDLTVTNPDGQQITRNGIINITAPTAAGAEVTGRVTKPNGLPVIGATLNLVGTFGNETYTAITKTDGSYAFVNVPVGNDVVVTPSKSGHTFTPSNSAFSVFEDLAGIDFTATPSAALSRTPVNDFDGDGISDHAVFRPGQNVWYILQSSTSTMQAEQFGLEGDVPVAADYDGDGKTDIAMWRPSNGVWYSKQSLDGAPSARIFGTQGDIPVYGYFDNDNKADLAIFRPETAEWWIQDSSTNASRSIKWGVATDKPVPQDYDGDGLTDIAVYRPENGTWYAMKSGDNSYLIRNFGLSGDLPVLGDYDGDGSADLTVFRPGDNVWYQLDSASSSNRATEFGLSTDLMIAGDYDGDSRSDIAVFREANSNWYVNSSLNNVLINTRWGMNNDIPIMPPSMR